MTTSLTQPPTSPAPPLPDIREQTVCLDLHIGSLGNRRKVAAGQIQTDADRTMVHTSIDLLDSPELQALHRHATRFLTWLDAQRTPAPLRRPGLWLLRTPRVPAVEESLQTFITERRSYVSAVIALYPQRVAEACARLGSLYDAGHYLPCDDPADPAWHETIRTHCAVTWRYVAFETPAHLASISRALYQQEQQKAAALWQAITEEARTLLRTELAALVTWLVEQTQPGTAQGQRLQQRSFDRALRLIEGFQQVDATQDDALQALTGQLREVLQGYPAALLRQSANIQSYVHAQFAAIQRHLDGMLEPKTRQYFLEE